MLGAPLPALHLLKSHIEAIPCVPLIVIYTAVERGMERKGKQRQALSFGRTTMLALELLQLAKRHILGQSDIEQCKIKPVAIAISSYGCLKAFVS